MRNKLLAEAELVQDFLLQLNACKSMGPDEVCPRVLKVPVYVTVRTFTVMNNLGNMESPSQLGSCLAPITGESGDYYIYICIHTMERIRHNGSNVSLKSLLQILVV